MVNPLIGIGFALGARILMKESVPTGKFRDGLLKLNQQVDAIAFCVESVDITDPVSWVTAGNSFLRSYLVGGTLPSSDSFSIANNLYTSPYAFKVAGELMYSKLSTETVARGGETDDGKVVEFNLGGAARMWGYVENGRLKETFLKGSRTPTQEVLDGVYEQVWSISRTLLLDRVDGDEGVEVSTMDIASSSYHGDLLQMIPKWELARANNIRRNILLQGRPGFGKTTFCYHVARQMNLRCLVVTATALSWLSHRRWTSLLDLLRPEMIIVNDIDRLQSHELGGLLSRFEEGECSVPLVMFTTNDISKLPQAMRRPGRIDQIIEVVKPSIEVENGILDKLAEREGVTIREDDYENLRNMMQDLSPAHVVEVFRRAKLYGWDDLDLEGDLTFDSTSYNMDDEDEYDDYDEDLDDEYPESYGGDHKMWRVIKALHGEDD